MNLKLALALLSLALVFQHSPVGAQASCRIERFFYVHDGLKLQAWVMLPTSSKSPVIVWNHGARANQRGHTMNSQKSCDSRIIKHGFAAIVPERRGYADSEGLPYRQWIEQNPGGRLARLLEETGDVIAAVDHSLQRYTSLDRSRVAIAGHSVGGTISVFSAGRRASQFHAVIGQGTGWGLNPSHTEYSEIIKTIVQNGGSTPAPILFQHEIHDRVVPIDYVKSVHDELRKSRSGTQLIAYDLPVASLPVVDGIPDGHAIFADFQNERYWEIWWEDFIKFVGESMR